MLSFNERDKVFRYWKHLHQKVAHLRMGGLCSIKQEIVLFRIPLRDTKEKSIY